MTLTSLMKSPRAFSSPRAIGAVASACALTCASTASAGRSFGEIFFFSVDTSSDGSTRIDWVGSALIWLLILMSVASVSLIVMAWMRNRPQHIMSKQLADQARKLVGEGRYTEALDLVRQPRNDLGMILRSALTAAPSGYDAMARSAEQTSDDLVMRRFRGIEVLNVLGQVAPMLGLFGTVYGVIVAFMTIANMGGSADPTALAGGIGTALVATFWGLLIAIPALSAYAMVRNTVESSSAEAAREVDSIIARFRPEISASAPAGGNAASTSHSSVAVGARG